MRKYSFLIVLALLVGSTTSYAQGVSATSNKVYVDYSIVEPATLEIISPSVMASNERGFKQVSVDGMEIKGVVSHKSGVKEITLNNAFIDMSSSGLFTTYFDLEVGDNFLTFEIVDNNGDITTKEFVVNREDMGEPDAYAEAKYYALVIGVEDYEDPGILDLDNPVNDASTLYQVLVSQYTFEAENTVLLKNPTRDEIYDKLDEFSEKVTDKDNFLLFYAGHGHWDKQAEIGYWLPADAEDDKKRDWMRNSAVTEYVREINSHHTLLITDACFGGSIFKTRKAFKDASMAINKLYEIPSRKAMTSGTLSEVPDKSVFMKYLLKHLNGNEAKHIASEQLFYGIKPAVLNNSPNTPQFGVMQSTGDEGGDFVFIRR